MRKEDMIARYEELYDRMSRSGDVRNMRTFGEAERAVFAELAGTRGARGDKPRHGGPVAGAAGADGLGQLPLGARGSGNIPGDAEPGRLVRLPLE